MNILNILHSGGVERYHAVIGVKPQTISEHSWGVSLIAAYILPSISTQAVLKALTHDCAEVRTGDVPFTTKRSYPSIKVLLDGIEKVFESENGITYKLTPLEKVVVKLSDMLEGVVYCADRYTNHGEHKAKDLVDRWLEVINVKIQENRKIGNKILGDDEVHRVRTLISKIMA